MDKTLTIDDKPSIALQATKLLVTTMAAFAASKLAESAFDNVVKRRSQTPETD